MQENTMSSYRDTQDTEDDPQPLSTSAEASNTRRATQETEDDPQPLSTSAEASHTQTPATQDDGDVAMTPRTPFTPHTPFTPGPGYVGVDEPEDDPNANTMAVDTDNARRVDDEEEEGEDLMGDDMVNDYRPIEQLDRYDVDPDAEHDDVDSMSVGARRQAERELRERDRREHHAGPGARHRLGGMNNEDSDEDEDDALGVGRRRRRILAQHRSNRGVGDSGTPVAASPMSTAPVGGTPTLSYGMAENDDDMGRDEGPVDLETLEGRELAELFRDNAVRREVYNRLVAMLKSFTDEKTNALIYMERIRSMAATNGQSLVVCYSHISLTQSTIGVWLADMPTKVIEIFNEAAKAVTLSIFPDYGLIHPEIFVRISDLPVADKLRDIRYIHLNTLIKVTGVVTRRSGVFPHLRMVKLNCEKCKAILAPNSTASLKPESSITLCPECGSRGPFSVNSEQTLFGNFQKINLQESPGSVPPGRLPRYKEVILLNDLIDSARPGDEVEVTGIYRHNVDPSINIMHGFPVFSTVIEANFVRKMEDAHADSLLTEDDVKQIRELSNDPRISERIFASIAPSIYGHSNIKRALALALFGGQAKEVGEKHRIRGDINVLMMGDPGTAKSQFLKYVEKTAHRAVYATGKGASAVGLTAVVHRDPVTREWTLEGGALVLADRGVCLIDEFDKMNDADRTSIHEAMEQQSISISKAGIVTTLQARCSVFAAANPVKGRYDPSISFFDNVDLTEPILSRFDVLCVVRDTVDATQDETLAKFVVDSHMRSHPQLRESEGMFDIEDEMEEDAADTGADVNNDLSDSGVKLIPQKLLRKYVLYARNTVAPKLSNMDKEKISSLYIDLRKESMSSGGMPIALRHLESIVRLAEAHAKVHLRDHVREDDINTAIAVMLESFFASQKYSLMRQMRRRFHKYLAYRRNDNDLLFYVLSGLVRDYAATQRVQAGSGGAAPLKKVEVDLEDFEARAREMNVYSCDAFYKSKMFSLRKFEVDHERGKIVKKL